MLVQLNNHWQSLATLAREHLPHGNYQLNIVFMTDIPLYDPVYGMLSFNETEYFACHPQNVLDPIALLSIDDRYGHVHHVGIILEIGERSF